MYFTTATTEDINELTKMRIAFISDAEHSIEKQTEQIILKKLPEYFLKHLGKDLIAFVAKEENEIVATAFLLIIEKPCNLSFVNGTIGNVLNVYTLPQFRRKGISTHLMNDLIEYAKKLGLDFVELKATNEGYPLYKKLGFCEHHSNHIDMKLSL